MSKAVTFDKAFASLEKLVNEIEQDSIQLEDLAQKVKEANVLIAYCENKLRVITETIEQERKK